VILTSDELVRDLRDIEWLIAIMNSFEESDCDDLDDLRWLRTRRRFLNRLLSVRRAQKGKKIVSLELWRRGHAPRAAGYAVGA
jgi:hypothetical protein